MGLTLQFAVGQKQAIISAVENTNFDMLDELESQNFLADFSLHIIPNDLDFLVNVATELTSREMFGLREHLDTTNYYYDSEEYGAYWVDSEVCSLFSEFQESDALVITTKWFDKMKSLHEEDIEVNDDAIDAVKTLIEICKKAKKENLDLVHIWFL